MDCIGASILRGDLVLFLFRHGLWTALVTVLLAYSSAQTAVEEKHESSHDIRCVIKTERGGWNRTTEAVISGTIENLTAGPLKIAVDPTLYLSSRTSSEMGDKYWAPADLLHDRSISIEKYAVSPDKQAEGIRRVPIHLGFKREGDKIDFRVDAQHLLWAKAISSVWPSRQLFSTVKSGDYDLQLVLETDKGNVESPKVKVSIEASKPPKQ
jgi:hypothetical protein